MLSYFFLWVAGMVSIVLLDILWIGVIASSFYKEQLESLLRMKQGVMSANIPAAIVVYMCMSLGICLFVVQRATTTSEALLYGAVFGLVLYGVYDFTNYALLKDWPWAVVVVDVLWGGALCALVSIPLFYLRKALS